MGIHVVIRKDLIPSLRPWMLLLILFAPCRRFLVEAVLVSLCTYYLDLLNKVLIKPLLLTSSGVVGLTHLISIGCVVEVWRWLESRVLDLLLSRFRRIKYSFERAKGEAKGRTSSLTLREGHGWLELSPQNSRTIQMGLLELLAREGIPLHYGVEELKDDLEVAKRLASRTKRR